MVWASILFASVLAHNNERCAFGLIGLIAVVGKPALTATQMVRPNHPGSPLDESGGQPHTLGLTSKPGARKAEGSPEARKTGPGPQKDDKDGASLPLGFTPR